MGVESLTMSRVVRFIIIFLVFDLLIYSGFVLHPTYSKHVGDDIPLAKKEDTATQQPFSSTYLTSSLSPTKSSTSNPVDEYQQEPQGTQNQGSVKVSPATPTPQSKTKDEVNFDTSHDAQNWGLSSQQCSDQFPGLFTEINRAVAFQKQKGVVTPEDIDISWKDDGAVRAQIIDQKLYILEAKITSDHPACAPLPSSAP
ncbi:hypothetical protein HYALB_00009439 [Hymenoscyphus albidus]|uniref:Uncharacterized protein n=1 Tax=Hymenoscyphus albidus TaxID=595503 RepID=A0A9N9LJE6_9HELO|nr:hypothetical protein HYALB_00009439 [Hymenoscyphus albidus]